MAAARSGACAALLENGSVLITGGDSGGTVLASVEMLGGTGRVTAAAPMAFPRAAHACVTLRDGRVLVAGGRTTGGAAMNTAEVYDPSTDSWHIAEALGAARAGATASLLKDGRVLIAGGESSGEAIATLEVYDPTAGRFTPVWGSLSSPRKDHAAAVLKDGRVVIAGGSDGAVPLASVDMFDPAAGTVSRIGKMSVPRQALTATTLLDGRVFLAGGSDGSADLASTEVFDPATGAFSAAVSMDTPRQGHVAFRIPHNNSVLIAGGTSGGTATSAAGMYIHWRAAYRATAPLSLARSSVAATALKRRGAVMLAGGTTRYAVMTDAVEVSTAPTIMTDKPDYAPGDTAIITGENWTPGATVSLVVTNVADQTVRWKADVIADPATGAITAQLGIVDADLGLTFALTATEPVSGKTAQEWTFTDAVNVGVYASDCSTAPASFALGQMFCAKATGLGNPPPYYYIQWVNSSAEVKHTSASNDHGNLQDAFAPDSTGIWTVKVFRVGPPDSFVTSATFTVVGDTTPPIITSNVTGTLGNNGWYTSNVTVTWTVTDPESTITSQTGCGTTNVSTDTTGTTFTCSATSAGGSAAQSVTIKRDATAPTIAFTSRTAANTFGWNNNDVTVNWSCSDSTSGPVAATATQTVSAEGKNQSATGTCTDNAGNTASNTQTGINIDKTAPSMTATPDRSADSNGWYNHSVTVTFSGTDSLSGIDASSCTPARVYNGPDTTSTDLSGLCKDQAGNQGSATFAVKYDATVPLLTGSRSPAANSNGWNNGDVTVTFTCTDATSQVATQPVSPQLVITEGADQSKTASCTDNAGNTANASVGNISIDKTAPTIAFTNRTAPNSFGWNNTEVIVNWNCSDPLSGPVSPTATQTVTGEGKSQSATGTCTDKAGNTASETQANINIDKTPPSVTAVPDRSADSNGWYNHAVTVTFSGTDSLSGIDISSCTPARLYNGPDTTSTDLSGSCKDQAGNQGNASFAVKYDATAPVLNGSRTPAANGNGWNNTDVTVTFTCTDATSLVATGPTTPQVVSTEGANQSRTATCTDNAGNTANASVEGINIDKTAPGITLASRTPANASGWNNTDVTINWNCSDSLSGPVSPTVSQTLITEGQNQPATATCHDKAGNSASDTQTGINIDRTPPTATATPDRAANSSGWYNQPVKVTFNWSDSLSGVDTTGCTSEASYSGPDSATASANAACKDRAGNPATIAYALKYDATPPVLTGSRSAAANAYGWINTDVTVTFNCTDATSLVAAGPTTPQLVNSEGANQWRDTTCTDNAGNSARAVVDGINVDKTAPTITFASRTIPNSFGWNNTDVTVNWACGDSLSGPVAVNIAQTVSGEGASQSAMGTCEDHAGNRASNTQIGISIDKTPPVIGGVASPVANAAGWNRSDVTITFVCTDALSDIALPPLSPQMVTDEGMNQSRSATCTDKAGNSAGAMVGPIHLDKSPPAVSTLSISPNPAPINTGMTVTANLTALPPPGSKVVSAEYKIDGGPYAPITSGDIPAESPTVMTNLGAFAAPGVHELCVRGKDIADNIGAETCTLLAVYDASGGFVTGGGWINSPLNAYVPDPTLTGKANFGFVSKYQKGASTPVGQTEFQFKVASLNFHSESYDWLVVAGAKAQYKGSGTINGDGDYGFMLTATDGQLNGGGGVDKFRMKIWDKATSVIVYDNQMGAGDTDNPTTSIAGGSIVVHK